MGDYLSFRRFITPSIIQIIFWVGVFFIVIAGLGMMSSAFGAFGGGGGVFLIGLLYLILGPVVWRVWCEIMLVLFRIYDELHLLRTGEVSEATARPTIQFGGGGAAPK